jgi:hypothetical protein
VVTWVVLGLAAVVGCVTTTTRTFLPSRQNPIYRPEQATPVLAEYLRLQCPAFRKASRPDTGHVRFRVTVGTSGFATRAELTHGSGDQLVDEVFGTVAAQLVFPRDSVRHRVRSETVTMNYRCAGDSATVRIG